MIPNSPKGVFYCDEVLPSSALRMACWYCSANCLCFVFTGVLIKRSMAVCPSLIIVLSHSEMSLSCLERERERERLSSGHCEGF